MYIQRVKNDSVWQSLKILFMGSLLIFLINIFFGFDNAVTPPAESIERWQILIHLHGGSIGWITLSAIGLAIWVHTGSRDVDAKYESNVRMLTWAAVLIIAGYVPSFGLAFSNLNGPLVPLLPLFGAGAVLILWISAIWSFRQFKSQPVLTTVHWLSAGALLTAAIGATVGMLLGLERALGSEFLPIEGDRVGAHAGMMDTYLFLVAAAIVELANRKEETRWGWGGLLQALFWMVGASLVPIAFFVNSVEQILPIFMLLLLIGMVIFIVRIAWRVLAGFSVGAGVKAWTSWGTLYLIVYMGLFLFAIVTIATGGGFEDLPTWYGAAFAHVGFVGMMTNVLFAVVASRAKEGLASLPWGEAATFWLMNLGLLTFIGLKIAVDIRIGAAVMGIGVLLGVFVMFRSMQKA